MNSELIETFITVANVGNITKVQICSLYRRQQSATALSSWKKKSGYNSSFVQKVQSRQI